MHGMCQWPARPFARHPSGAFMMRTRLSWFSRAAAAVPGRLLSAGFHFEFPGWPEAAENLVQLWRHRND